MTASTDARASPLAAWQARFAAASATPGRFSIRELAFGTQIDVRGDARDPGFARAALEALGFAWPQAPNTWAGRPDCAALWLGPDEWLVTAAHGRARELCAALASRLAGTHHAVTDVSAARAAIELAGDDARSVLAKGCALDLHARAFAPPQCAQSLLARAQVIVQCVSDRPVFRLYVRRSFAGYLAAWLLDAASETRASLALDAERLAAHLR